MKYLLALAFVVQDAKIESLEPVKEKGLAKEYPGDAGIEKDKRVIFAEGFEAGELKAWSETKGKAEFVDDAHGGRKALRFTATLGEDTGGHLYKMLDPGHEKLHFRFYVRFPKEHEYVHHFVHLVGYNPATRWPQGGAGERPDGDERFSTGIEPWGDWGKHAAPGIWNLYTYWCEMKKAPDGKYWGNSFRPEKPVEVVKDRWTCVEFMIKCNTVGKADGEQAFWIDGECAGRWGGYRWRTDAELKVNGVWLLYYITENAAKQNHVDDPAKVNQAVFDDLVVATEYIGPRTK